MSRKHNISGLAGRSPHLRVVEDRNATGDLSPISADTLRKDQGRLKQASEAWSYLESIGLNPEEIKERFGVGLAALSHPRDDRTRGQWLTAPVVGRDGVLLKRVVRLVVPDLSINPQDSESWCPGPPLTYWCARPDEKPRLFVAPRVRDAWRIWQAIRGTSLEARMAIIASTDYSALPAEWKSPDFWSDRQRIYLGHDNDACSEPLRQELHAWGMANILDAHRRYRDKVSSRSSRADQIAAPLPSDAYFALSGSAGRATVLGFASVVS